MENPPVFPEGWPSNSHLLTARPFHKQNLSPMRKKSLRPSPAQSALSQYITIITAWCINNAFLHCIFHWWLFGYSILPLFILIPKWFQGFGASFQDSFWWVKVVWDKAPESVVLALAMQRDFKITLSRRSKWGTNFHCNLGFGAQRQTSSKLTTCKLLWWWPVRTINQVRVLW